MRNVCGRITQDDNRHTASHRDWISAQRDCLNRIRIIIADDHVEMLQAVVRLLEADFEVLAITRKGDAALEAVICRRPDVVILDISMPVLTGIEVAQRIKTMASEVRIVFLTVHEDPDFIRESFRAGGSAYVTKSRMVSDLRFAINEVLAGRSFVSPSSTSNGNGIR